MQSAEEFMREYFGARTAEIERELSARTPFRQRFFFDDCFWDSRKGMLEWTRTEAILEVSPSKDGFDVTTTGMGPGTDPFPRLRYHLQAAGEKWMIRFVDTECLRCRGAAGKIECVRCLGTGWLEERDYAQRMERIESRRAARGRNIPPSRGRRF
jgi:hypothetical protein